MFTLLNPWMAHGQAACREAHNAHAQYHLHLLNDGRFPATVKLGLASQGGIQAATPPATPATGKPPAKGPAAAAKPGQAAGKGQAAPPATPAAYHLSTQVT